MAGIRIATFNCENLFARFKFNKDVDPEAAVRDGWDANRTHFDILGDVEKAITAQAMMLNAPSVEPQATRMSPEMTSNSALSRISFQPAEVVMFLSVVSASRRPTKSLSRRMALEMELKTGGLLICSHRSATWIPSRKDWGVPRCAGGTC